MMLVINFELTFCMELKQKMVYRYDIVIHTLFEFCEWFWEVMWWFVNRRGHTVLASTLPDKEEHVLLCRLTDIQRRLYSTFMSELAATKAMANPLKAFAICCKVSDWW